MAYEINEKQIEWLRLVAANPRLGMSWMMCQSLKDGGFIELESLGCWKLTDAGKQALAALLPDGTPPDAVRLPSGRTFAIVGTAAALALIERATNNARTVDGEFGSNRPGCHAEARKRIDADEQALLDLLADRDARSAKVRELEAEIEQLTALRQDRDDALDLAKFIDDLEVEDDKRYLGGPRSDERIVVANLMKRAGMMPKNAVTARLVDETVKRCRHCSERLGELHSRFCSAVQYAGAAKIVDLKWCGDKDPPEGEGG